MNTSAYLHSRFGIESVSITQRADGAKIMTSSPPLADYPVRMSDKLLYWAEKAPERPYMARRGADGQWRSISYAQLLASAQRIGQALLDRGLSVERPLVILSENDLDHALMAMAAIYVGIPYAPISTAYSLVSQDHEKLRHVMQLLTPGMDDVEGNFHLGKDSYRCL